MSAGLETVSVGMSFGGVDALKDVSLSLPPGSWTGLIGPNGSGKSTLLNVISGVYLATSGSVTLDADDVTNERPRRRARRGLVRTFQHPQLSNSLTLVENVALGRDLAGRIHGGSRTTGHAILDPRALLDLLGCSASADRLPEEVPYGARKIAEVARAIAARPRYLLLDEPAAGLSAGERQELVSALRTVRDLDPALTACLVEHDVGLVRATVDSIAVLNAGTLLCHGDADTVLSDERVRVAYLGSAGAPAPSARNWRSEHA